MGLSDVEMSKILSKLLAEETRCKTKEELIRSVVKQGDTGNIYSLLRAGADVNVKGADVNVKDQALRIAAQEGKAEILKCFISAGANVNARTFSHKSCRSRRVSFDRDGDTPLMLAVQNDELKCMTILIEAGADVNTTDAEGNTILIKEVDVCSCECLRKLIEAGADVNWVGAHGCHSITCWSYVL